MDEKIQSQIDKIMDWFDFEKVKTAMHAMNWKWSIQETKEVRVPEIAELRTVARSLLKKL